MKKSINHLGCSCRLPEDQGQKRFVCPNCETRYERNALVLRWFVAWTPQTKGELIDASSHDGRLASLRWSIGTPDAIEAGTSAPTDAPGTSINNPIVDCCGRDAADCDCTHKQADRRLMQAQTKYDYEAGMGDF